MDKETHKKLIANFPKSAVKQAPKGKFGNYVPHHLYTKRLVDTIAGKYNFSFDEIRDKSNSIVGAKCVLEIEGLGRVEEVGDVDTHAINRGITESEILKLAVSDGIKRCCMRFGIGLELWVGDMTEEEHYSGEYKEVVNQLENSSQQVVKETKKDDYKVRINNELEHAEKDNLKRNSYKLEAWNLFKQTNETDMSKWSDFELDKFLDTFYEVQAKYKAEEENIPSTELVEEVFGEVKDVGRYCPQCNSMEWIEDNREKKASDSKFENIPDFTCSNYGQSNGCGWGGYIDSKGDRAVPTQWL